MFRGGNFERYLGGVCRSDDNMASWEKTTDGMPPNCVTTHIILDPESPPGNRTLYVAGFGKGVYKSTDDGRTWGLKNNGISGNPNAWRLTLTPEGRLYLLVARGLESGRVIDGAMYVSTDGAESWRKSPMPPGANAPNDLIPDPENPRRMYLSCWPVTVDGVERYGGLWATNDGGESWANIFDESGHVYASAVDPEDPSVLYINTFDSAAYRSDDGGESWERLRGYNFKWGHRPVVDIHNEGMLYLTTFGGSVRHGPAKGVPDAFEDIYPF
jgi:photosystem II stability/assembly factor-like uncharacterized protein